MSNVTPVQVDLTRRHYEANGNTAYVFLPHCLHSKNSLNLSTVYRMKKALIAHSIRAIRAFFVFLVETGESRTPRPERFPV